MSHLETLLKRASSAEAANDKVKLGVAVKSVAEYSVLFDDATPEETAGAKALTEKYPNMVDKNMVGAIKKKRELEAYNAEQQRIAGARE